MKRKFNIGNKVRVKKLSEKEFKKIHKKWGVPYEVYTEQYKKYFGKIRKVINNMYYTKVGYSYDLDEGWAHTFFEEDLELAIPYKRIIKGILKNE